MVGWRHDFVNGIWSLMHKKKKYIPDFQIFAYDPNNARSNIRCFVRISDLGQRVSCLGKTHLPYIILFIFEKWNKMFSFPNIYHEDVNFCCYHNSFPETFCPDIFLIAFFYYIKCRNLGFLMRGKCLKRWVFRWKSHPPAHPYPPPPGVGVGGCWRCGQIIVAYDDVGLAANSPNFTKIKKIVKHFAIFSKIIEIFFGSTEKVYMSLHFTGWRRMARDWL